jgi:branched-chain amino acid transport system substrate-binding protein
MTRIRVFSKVVLFLFLVFGLVLSVIPAPLRAVETEPIRIGTIMSISGWAGFIGSAQKELFAAMIEDINAKGGVKGRPIEVYYEDDKSVPTNAVIAATKLIKDKKIVVLVGTSTSDAAMAVVPVCEQEQTPFINCGPANISFKKWVFSVGPGDVIGSKHVLDYAVKELGAKRLGLLYGSDAYGMLAYKVMTEELPKYPGISLVAEERFEISDTNMVPQLTKVKSANPDVLILYTTGGAGAVIAKNYKQLGMTAQVLGGNALTMPDFLKIAGKIAEESGWIFMSQPMMIVDKMAPDDPFRRNVVDPVRKMMQAKYGPTKQVTLFHGSFWDGIMGAVEAMKIAPTIDRASIRDGLEKVKFDGFLGIFSPTPTNHRAAQVDPMRPMVFKNGEFLPYTKNGN